MLQIENEHETPMETNYYQNNHVNFRSPDNNQEIIDYTEQEPKRKFKHKQYISKTHPTKYNYTKKKFGQNHFF